MAENSPPLRDAIRMFLRGVRGCRSVDCVLTELSNVVAYLEDLVGVDAAKLVDLFLRDDRVANILAGLRPSIDVVKSRVLEDPRFENLRRYLDLILESIACASRVHVPTRIFLLEEVVAEGGRGEGASRQYGQLREAVERSRGAKGLMKVLAVVLPILAITLLLTLHPGTLSTLSKLFAPHHVESVEIDGMKLSVVGNQLVVEYRGRWLPYLWVKCGNETIHLSPWLLNSSNAVVANYVFVNSTYSEARFPLNRLLTLLNESRALPCSVILMPVSEECSVDVENRTLVFGTCSYFSTPLGYGEALKLLTHRVLEEVLLWSVNRSVLNYLRHYLFGNESPRSLADAAWHVLQWVDRNAVYEPRRGSVLGLEFVKTPLEFLENPRGVCADYAVFTAAALLAAGFNESYILVFETSKGMHATAGAVINGTLFVLDQHLPVYEWSDYVQYVFKPVGSEMEVIKLSLDSDGESTLVIRTVSPGELAKTYPDTYPQDAVPREVVYEAFRDLAKKLGALFAPYCSFNRVYLLEVPQLRAYSPAFRHQFVEYLKMLALRELRPYLESASCVWVEERGSYVAVYIG